MKKLHIPLPRKFVVFYTLEKENNGIVHQYVNESGEFDAEQALQHFEIIFKDIHHLEKYYDYQIVGTLEFDYANALDLNKGE